MATELLSQETIRKLEESKRVGIDVPCHVPPVERKPIDLSFSLLEEELEELDFIIGSLEDVYGPVLSEPEQAIPTENPIGVGIVTCSMHSRIQGLRVRVSESIRKLRSFRDRSNI